MKLHQPLHLKALMFTAVELKQFRNLTWDVDVLALNNSASFEAVEFSDKIIVFQLPVVKMAVGNLVSLVCFLHHQKVVEFPITGKVSFCENNATEKLIRVGVELRQYDKDLWKQFLKSASEAQARVDLLLGAMKGENNGR